MTEPGSALPPLVVETDRGGLLLRPSPGLWTAGGGPAASPALAPAPAAEAPSPAAAAVTELELEPGGPGMALPPVARPGPGGHVADAAGAAADSDARAAPPGASQAASASPPLQPVPAGAPASPLLAAHAGTPARLDGAPPAPATAGSGAGTWMAGGVAVLAALGWVMERRRRRLLEMEKDSVLWADVQPAGASIITTAGGLDDILPDSPDPAEAARAIYVTAIGETNSRREATLIDLHQLQGKLRRRRERGDNVAAVLLLQQHLVDFRYTSPWVFLELREQYRVLDRPMEWEVAREAFRKRFGQNAPVWTAPANEDAGLLDDAQLTRELSRYWPYREARMFLLRWMLGESEMRQKCSGPPLLPLGIYREMMMLDKVLDEVMVVRPRPADSLL